MHQSTVLYTLQYYNLHLSIFKLVQLFAIIFFGVNICIFVNYSNKSICQTFVFSSSQSQHLKQEFISLISFEVYPKHHNLSNIHHFKGRHQAMAIKEILVRIKQFISKQVEDIWDRIYFLYCACCIVLLQNSFRVEVTAV